MAASLTGTPVSFGSTVNNSSTSITIPSDCNGIAVFWCGWQSGTTNMTSITINGVTMTLQQNNAVAGDADACGVATLANPSTGAQTIAWDWSGTGAISDGALFIVAYLKNCNTSSLVSSSNSITSVIATSTTISCNLTTAATDFCLGVATSYVSNPTGAPASSDQTVDLDNQSSNNVVADLFHEITTDNPTTAMNGTGDYPTVVALSFAAASTVEGSKRKKTLNRPGAVPFGFTRFSRMRRNYNTSALSTITGTLAKTNANDTLSGSGSVLNSGTVAKANANDTLAASGSVLNSGALATTNANDTSAASGSSSVTGTVAKTNANDSVSASGSVLNSGTLATTNANDSISASGTVTTVNSVPSRTRKLVNHPGSGPYSFTRFSRMRRNYDSSIVSTITGTLAKTNVNDSVSAAGSVLNSGTVAKTNANDTLAGSGSVLNSGTLATTNTNDTSVASGSVLNSGTLAKTNANDTLSASGTPTINGTVAKTNNNDSISASGSVLVSGTLATTNANDSVSASGSSGNPTGTVNVTNGNDILIALGIIELIQGGGGGKKRKPFKSYDQRQRERLEQIKLDEDRRNKEKYGDLPKGLSDALDPALSPYKRLSPEKVAAYQNAVHSARQDDEVAMNLIMSLI